MNTIKYFVFATLALLGIHTIQTMENSLEDDERLFISCESSEEEPLNNDSDILRDDESVENISETSDDERIMLTEVFIEQAHNEEPVNEEVVNEALNMLNNELSNHTDQDQIEHEDPAETVNRGRVAHNGQTTYSNVRAVQQEPQVQPTNPIQKPQQVQPQPNPAHPGNCFSNHKLATVFGITAISALGYYVYTKWQKNKNKKQDKKDNKTKEVNSTSPRLRRTRAHKV